MKGVKRVMKSLCPSCITRLAIQHTHTPSNPTPPNPIPSSPTPSSSSSSFTIPTTANSDDSPILCEPCETTLLRDVVIPPSPVPEILGRNVMPNATEVVAIRNAIADISPGLSRLEDEIMLMGNVLENLLYQREKTRQFLKEHQNLLAPFHRVPIEILEEIFHQYHLVSDNGLGGYIRRNDGPLLLSQVCHLWRELVINTPRFWSSMRFTVAYTQQETTLSIARLWLERSRQSPLKLVVKSLPGLREFGDYSLLDMLSQHSDQWEDVDFSLCYNVVRECTKIFNRAMPMVKSLTLDGVPLQPNSTYPGFEIANVAHAAPQLRKLTIGAATLLPTVDRYPWGQLTQLSIYRGIVIDQAFHILSSAPNLEDCALFCETGRWNVPLRPCTLSKLRSLNLRARTPLAPLLDRLTTPVLRDLVIASCCTFWHQEKDDGRAVASFARSTLECLSLQKIDMSQDELLTCLEKTPLLSRLEITNSGAVYQKVLDRLKWDCHGGTDILVPRLQHLVLENCVALGLHTKLVSVVESRWYLRSCSECLGNANATEAARLRVLGLAFPEHKGLNESDLVRLEYLKQRGLDFTMDGTSRRNFGP